MDVSRRILDNFPVKPHNDEHMNVYVPALRRDAFDSREKDVPT